MRVHVAGAAVVLILGVGLSASRAGDASGGTKAAGIASAPVIDIWYGSDQRFGAIGTPQRRANILGSASHATGIKTLTYRINGGSSRALSFTPDTRRIISSGDFNIDLRFDELYSGANTVVIKAVANSGDSAQTTVTVRNLSGAVWPLPYTYTWSQFVDSAQIVDGKWSLMGGGARILEPGYDRLIAIGDTTWTDYEATVKVMVHGIDSSQAAWGSSSGGPGIGLLMRWKGHTNTPVFSPPITQPLSGYIPLGAIGWFHWRKGWGYTNPNEWEIMAPSAGDLATHSPVTTTPLYYGVQYIFKMQVKSSGSGPLYKFRVWRAGTAEPTTWLMTWQEPTSAIGSGSLVLLAHHVSATFGAVTITPTPDGIPPVISNIVATPAATTATITWATDEPATSSVAYGLTSSYGNVASDLVNMVTSHSIQLQNLTPSTLYHYAVTSADWGGASSTSTDLTFQTTVLTPPLPPALVSPGNTSSGNPLAVTLVWRRASTATGYRVQLGTDTTFATGILVDDASLIDTSRAVSGLTPGTRYYWRVDARNAGGEGSFSSVSVFTTALGIPVLASPVNGAMNISSAPALSWLRVPSATSYRVRVSTDSTFGGVPAFDDSTIVDTFRVANGLQVGQKYYWRVQARNSFTVGTFSSAWTFTPGLASPVLLIPANGAANQSVNSTLRWRSVSLATWYDIQLGTDPTFSSGLIVTDSLIADTTRTVSGLSAGTVYYWRVRSRNASGVGQYSAPWSFSTGLGNTQLLAPADGSKDMPLNLVRFSWNQVSSATAYAFQLATDSTFNSGLIKNDTSIVETSRVVSGLSYKTTYYWHVRARQGGLIGPMSPAWKFTTTPNLPTAVQLIALADGARIPADTARFIWTSAQPGVNRYWFEMAFDSLFLLTNIDSTVRDTTAAISLAAGARYFWRVRAGNPDGWGPFSVTRHFDVITSIDQPSEQGLPGSFALDQNYPNPFNPSTWIHFALPRATHVKLDVYTVLGERVASLLDEGMEAGFHRVEFSARDGHGRALPSGVYLYRLVTPGYSAVKKMMLVK